ncbi:MAG: radical SAM protein [Planctomycetota bacterium]
MDSIYWVISRDCNQKCPHCYNNSEPGAAGLTLEQISQCVRHFPDPDQVDVSRIILSGGEVLVWPELLFHSLDLLYEKYRDRTQLWIQSNGDLLDAKMLDRLLESHVSRIDISSMDQYHSKRSQQRKTVLEELFHSRGMRSVEPEADEQLSASTAEKRYAFWGATEEEWIGPLWPRGRAFKKRLSQAGPEDRFCSMWSGAKNFLDYDRPGSEINLQLADVYPCCPMTCRPIGNLLDESLIGLLDRCQHHPVYRALNAGRPEAMGISYGLTEAYGIQRTEELGNHCLWCDEFFTKHAPDLLKTGCVTERGRVDLVELQIDPL